jgi:transposase
MPASRHSVIRLVLGLPEEALVRAPRVLGIDDFAFRRGRAYGTVLIDMETGTIIDVLPDRETETVRKWLEDHPGAAVICRDRGTGYGSACAQGAPGAIQVADRWHLLHNLSEWARKAVTAACWTPGTPRPPSPANWASAGPPRTSTPPPPLPPNSSLPASPPPPTPGRTT